jgi:hypothetical protein
MHGSEAR